MQLQKQIAALSVPKLIPLVSPEPTAKVDDPTADWKTYTSSRYSYSFKYPSSWDLLTWNEAEQKNLSGTHTLQNYSTNDIEKFMDHGNVDWQQFIGNKPAIKLDISVLDKTNPPSGGLPNSTKEVSIEGLSIGNAPTKVYITEDNDAGPYGGYYYLETVMNARYALSLYVYIWNDPNKQITNTPDWNVFTQILSTFKFLDSSDTTGTFTCPQSGWVDCMPMLDEAKKKACSQEAMVWYKANCPNFQGAAM